MIGRTNSGIMGGGTVPDGATVTPVDDVSILLKCAGIKDKNYTTMEEVFGDDNVILLITMDENAMKYLARSTGFADEVSANETFMTFLGASAYVDDTILNSDFWVTIIVNSSYIANVFNSLIVKHTSNTEPCDPITSKNNYENMYKATNGSIIPVGLDTDSWSKINPWYVNYHFDSPKDIFFARFGFFTWSTQYKKISVYYDDELVYDSTFSDDASFPIEIIKTQRNVSNIKIVADTLGNSHLYDYFHFGFNGSVGGENIVFGAYGR